MKLSATVLLTSVSDSLLAMPPPPELPSTGIPVRPAKLSAIVLLVTIPVPALKMPPPTSAELSAMVESVTFKLPELKMPPPYSAVAPVVLDGAVVDSHRPIIGDTALFGTGFSANPGYEAAADCRGTEVLNVAA